MLGRVSVFDLRSSASVQLQATASVRSVAKRDRQKQREASCLLQKSYRGLRSATRRIVTENAP